MSSSISRSQSYLSTFIEGLLLKLYFLFTTHCCRYLMSPLLQTGKLRHRNLGEPGRLTHRCTVTWPFPSELSGILRQLRTCTVAGTRGLGHEVAGRQGTTCMNGTGGLRPSIPQGCCSLSSSRPGLGQGFSHQISPQRVGALRGKLSLPSSSG